MTLSEVTAVKGRAGDFTVEVLKHPRYVDLDKCIACGACSAKCPKKVDDEHNQGLDKRKAIYVKYSQAVPLKYCIDAENCLYLTKGKCGNCAKVCPTGAVNYEDKPETVEIKVGSIILASGFAPYDPGRYDTYGYTRHQNVITSLEFERLLAASGPTLGHVARPSDHQEPRRVAFIQCVGSRDVHQGARGYCSAVCCTYAVKEAGLAMDHVKGLEASIFYMDMRTTGKDFERYYNRAQENGVRFIKSRISSLGPGQDEGDLEIRYTTPEGVLKKENFNLVVLSVGLVPGPAGAELAGRLGLELDGEGFPTGDGFKPVRTVREGIYACGAVLEPKDIPQSVIDASAVAGEAAALLSSARGTLTRSREPVAETNVTGEPPRIGVFICHCGTNIAGVVDVEAVEEYAKTLPYVTHTERNLFSCSQDSQEKIARVIKEQNLNRLVVAACTPRTHEPLFQETATQAGLNKYLFEMANIRNQCSWVHSQEPEKATRKSKELVAMAVAKAANLRPLREQELAVNNQALVIGGGVAGMEAAANLASQGFKAIIVERAPRLGGQALKLGRNWQGREVAPYLEELIKRVSGEEKIEIHLGAEITKVQGFVGNFETTIAQDGQEKVLQHGAAIIASGAAELDEGLYLHGQDPRVVTGLELEERLAAEPDLAGKAKTAVFIQCVGSRIPERPYCSKVCCTQSINSALRLKELNPGLEIYVVHKDIRTYGRREDLYRRAREAGIHFVRYEDQEPLTVSQEGGELKVVFTDFNLRRRLALSPDLLVLASAIVAPQENPLGPLFKVPLNQDNFFAEAHVKLRPVDFATDGVFVCGLAHGPKPLEEAIAQAQAAAARAAVVLSSTELMVGGVVSSIDQTRCVSCGVCISICPYQAIDWNEAGKAQVNEALCKGCGLCEASCRSSAPHLGGFTDELIFNQMEAVGWS